MKKIILIITGSIAAPKALDLYHLLKKKYQISVILTPSAHKFVHIADDMKIYDQFLERDFYQKTDPISHTDLALHHDFIIVYPATMTFISKAALAICDNLALATYLASDVPKIIFPAMNHNMYHNQGLQNNLILLQQDPNVTVIETNKGMLACNVVGDGRLKEAKEALAIINAWQANRSKLAKKKILINYGASRTYLDDMRYLTNNSSGKMGQALVQAFLMQGAHVVAVVGDVSIPLINHKNLTVIRAFTNQAVYHAMKPHFVNADIALFVAALNDYQLQHQQVGKISKSKHPNLQLNLSANLDVLATLAKTKKHQIVVGFSAQDSNDEKIAKAKMQAKNCDGMVMNHITTMNQNETEVKFYWKKQSYHFRGSKIKVAQAIVDVLSKALTSSS